MVLPSGTVDTDDQTLYIQNDTLYIADGNGIPIDELLSDSLWIRNGVDIYNGNTGNVGIKTTTPNAPLQVVGATILGADGQSVSGANSSICLKILSFKSKFSNNLMISI
mgnify:CR=1 FL=1